MSDIAVDLDGFASAMTDLLKQVSEPMPQVARKAVREGLKVGKEEWSENAESTFAGTYVKHGHQYTAGQYAKSIKSHMFREGDFPTGEIGSPSMPGLPHLLEKGHAIIGGGRVPGYEHISPAADIAFEETMNILISEVESIL